MKPRRKKQGGVKKSSGDFLPLDSTGEIDTGKLPPVLHTAHSSFLNVTEKIGDDIEKKKAAKLFQAAENSGEQGLKNISLFILAKNPPKNQMAVA